MDIDLTPCLEDIENRIDAAVESDLLAQWKTFADDEFTGDLFSPRRPAPAPPAFEWPTVSLNAGLDSPAAMALHQLTDCSGILENATGHLLSIRCNYGTSILPSLFGVKPFLMDEKLDTLPTSHPLDGGRDAMRRIVDNGVPPLTDGDWPRVIETAKFYRDLLAPFPKTSRAVHIYHPDLQGPLDCTELLWGSDIFLAFMDQPDLVKAVLQLIVDTYTALMKEWFDLFPPENGHAVHWHEFHRGHIMLRNDSAMNISPDMFDEFVVPFDSQLLATFGGGAEHFCGRGDHYIASLSDLPGVNAVNLTQPEYNDMETIFRFTVDRGIQLIGLDRAAAEEALAAGRDLHGNVHVK